MALLLCESIKMALILNLPILKENPVIVAETRPQKISLYLTSLRAQNPQELASYLLSELSTLNRQKVSPTNRIQALDTYRPMLINTCHALAEHYSDAALPLHSQEKAAASAAESLWLELGYGYKLALVDLQNQLFKIGNNTAHCIQHAMHAIAEQALVYYQTYVTPPSHLWGDLHQLYFCAVQLGVQNQTLLDIDQQTTIENTYVHALLMSLADTQHLSQQNIRLAATFLANHLKDTHISAVAPLESTAGAFVIDLKSNQPPVAFSKRQTFPDPATDILLLTIDLVRALHLQLSNLQNNQLVSATRENEIDLLTYLIMHWGITPKRLFRRLPKNGDLELVTGIADIQQVSNPNMAINQPEGKQIKPILPSRWQILNISASGMSIRRHPTAEKNIRIGSLVGIKTKNEAQWSLAVVRWANCKSRDKLDIGLELIAPQTDCATASIAAPTADQQGRNETVLLVPENTATKQTASIIVPRGTYATARQLTLKHKNVIQYALLTKLIDRTQHFEQVQYSVIE